VTAESFQDRAARLALDLGRARARIRQLEAEKAEVWSQGEAAGWSRAMRHMSDEPLVGRAANPYVDFSDGDL
jgi:hypothetical protein